MTVQSFLESKFGFWLITTLLVGAATATNAYLQNYFAGEHTRKVKMEQLDLEIEYRLSQFMVGLAQMTNDEVTPWMLRSGYTAEDVRALTQILIGTPKAHKDIVFFSMFPSEFVARPLASLLAESASLRPARARDYKEQIAFVSGGRLFGGNDFKGRDFGDVKGLASEVNRALISKRVSGEFFSYTDCPTDSPLC